MKNNNTVYLPILLAITLFTLVNMVSNSWLSNLSLDLTQDKVYTLSSGTENIVSSLEDNLVLKLFYSEKHIAEIPSLQSYLLRIKNILKRYAKLSDGKISLQFIEVEAFSVEEDAAVEYGIQAVPIDRNGNSLYLGLAITNSVDDTKLIPFFDLSREIFLEYDLTRNIYDLTTVKQATIGLISGLPRTPEPTPGRQESEEWTILAKLAEQFNIQDIAIDATEINKNLDVLVILHPENLSLDTQYAIDQYVLSGGKLLIFVDPFLEIPSNQGIAQSNLDKLFSVWGIELIKNKVLLDRENALQVSNSQGYGRTSTKLNWLALSDNYINSSDLITSDLNKIYAISAGAIKDNTDDNIDFISLLNTSVQTRLASFYETYNSSGLIRNFISDDTEYNIAARLSGKFTTAFPDKKNASHLTSGIGEAHIVVVADVDMLRDRFWARKQNFFGQEIIMQISDNFSLVSNALDKLQGNTDLISLRSRKKVDYPFTVVDQLRKQAEARFLEEEEKLKSTLAATEQKILSLQQNQQDSNQLVLDKQQAAAINDYKLQMVKTRKQLRKVQHSLNTDIDNLGSLLKFLNILLIPLLLLLAAPFIPYFLGIKKS